MVAGTSTPVAILPLGTANNVATSMGIGGEMTELIASWHRARRVPFDLGHARAGSKTWLVVEGAGGGLIPAGIAAAERQRHSQEEAAPPHPSAEVATAVRAFYDVLDDLEPVRQGSHSTAWYFPKICCSSRSSTSVPSGRISCCRPTPPLRMAFSMSFSPGRHIAPICEPTWKT